MQALIKIKAGLKISLMLVFCLFSAVEKANAADVVRQVLISGTQRIEAETIRSYMLLTEGDAFSSDKINRSLKALFATGLFADVSIRREGDALMVRVVENPIVNRVQFEGNKRITDETLNTEVQLKPRSVYTRTKVQNDVKRILDIYRRSGRFAATVEPKLIQLEQNRVDVAFEINEGPKTGIRRINFVGNNAYGDSKLREVLQTKEERWWRVFTSDDSYDPDRITYDRELLRRHYMRNGYADFRVVSVVAELTPDREDFFVVFTIEEGEKYKFGKVDIDVKLPDLKKESLLDLIQSNSGKVYNSDKIEDTVQKLTDAVGSKGYAFVDVRPKIERDKNKQRIDLVYEIQEGPRVFVDRIEISGNVRTLDKVIRREFRLVEGDAFNSAKLRRSRQRLQNLGFFEKVEVNHVPSDEVQDRATIKVDVQEKSTGEISFGVGLSTLNGAMFDVGVRERNLLGRGQDLRTSFNVSQRATQIDLSFTEPYFMDKPMSAGFDLFSITKKMQKETSYDEKTQGFTLRTGYSITENLSQSLRYSLKEITLENVKSTASTYIKSQEGTTLNSSVGQILLYDKRDNRLSPTEGYFLKLSNDLAGLGGDRQYFKTGFETGYYYPVDENVVFNLSGRTGYIIGLGQDTRVSERYFLGGDTLRGFAVGGVSPRDKATGDPVGGVWMASGSAELVFPIGLPNEFGIAGKLFGDVGVVGAPDDAGAVELNDARTPRISFGTGVNWKSPMGPVSIDLGFPVMKESFDKTEVFRFNFGSRF